MARCKYGICPLCGREVGLTFHHLTPKKLHKRRYYRKHYSKTALQQGIDICRLCHKGIHALYDETTLAKRLYSLELLREDTAIQKHSSWVAKQRRVS